MTSGGITTSTSSVAPIKVKTEIKVRATSPIEEKPLHITDMEDLPAEQLVSVDDDGISRESGVNLLPTDGNSTAGTIDIELGSAEPNFGDVLVGQEKTESDGSNSRQTIKEEIIDVDELDRDGPPLAKKAKTEFVSEDNSASLPGIAADGSTMVGPVGFEPGMFKQEDGSPAIVATGSSKSKGDSSQKVRQYNCFV